MPARSDVRLAGPRSLSEFCAPPLTTVHIPRARIGRLMFEILRPEGASTRVPGREVVIDPELVLRESTGPAPKAPPATHA